MEAQDFEVFTTAEIRQKLGRFYLSKVLAKDSELSYQQIRTVLAGEAGTKDLIEKVMTAAKAAIAAQEEINALNAHIANKKAS